MILTLTGFQDRDRDYVKNMIKIADATYMKYLTKHNHAITCRRPAITCPIFVLSLQKKSFARHVRPHSAVKPEMCPYCQKEVCEKRALNKHIRAIHETGRPFACEHCTHRNQIDLKKPHQPTCEKLSSQMWSRFNNIPKPRNYNQT